LIDTQKVIEREWRKDHGMLAFLDMFHHRLMALLVKVRKAHRPSLWSVGPHQGPVAQYLFSCFGLGLPQLRNRLGLPDRCLLFYSNILSHHPHSGSGLERLLSDYFQVHAAVRQLEGTWRPIEPEDWTAIGQTGRNQELGRGASLGARVWDQQGRFAVTVGPLRLAQFLDFLPLPDRYRPMGSGFRPLCEMTRFYAGQQFEFSFHLRLSARDVPGSRLSSDPQKGRTWLGWTSWLHDDSAAMPDGQVRPDGKARPDGEVRLSGRQPQFPPRLRSR
jgi:type VI secretion system protein ImpH